MEINTTICKFKKDNEKNIAFLILIELYELRVISFQLQNAPAEFCRYIQDILKEFVRKYVAVYINNIINIFENSKRILNIYYKSFKIF
jgi:hypothetical protein